MVPPPKQEVTGNMLIKDVVRIKGEGRIIVSHMNNITYIYIYKKSKRQGGEYRPVRFGFGRKKLLLKIEPN